MSKRLFTSGFIFLICVFGIIFIFKKSYENSINNPVDARDNQRIIFEIEKGEKITSISKRLKEKNIISSSFFFNLYLKKENLDKNIVAGKFVLTKSLTITEIVKILRNAVLGEIPVTIPEGFTVFDIDNLLAKKEIIEKGDFEKCAALFEGYLFPDTYFVSKENFDCEKFAARMRENLEQKISTKMKEDIKSMGKTLNEIIIMASLIEKETLTPEERPIVSGILWKRLKIKMPLAVDAATRYYKRDWISPLTSKDFEENNSYNTRKNLGLPKTPIGNPGEESIKAAIYPEKTEYLYYLHDKDGNVHYATTHDEHVANKRKYLY